MDYQLTELEQATLAALLPTEGFRILQKIMESEVFRFNTSLLNAKEPKDVLRYHNLASAAAKFYQGVIDRLNREAEIYLSVSKSDEPIDPDYSVLEMDTEEHVRN